MACSVMATCGAPSCKDADEEITPATALPDAESDGDSSPFGCESDEGFETPKAHENEELPQAPRQLTAGPPPPPMDQEEAPQQLTAGPPPPLSDEVPRQLQQGPPPPLSSDANTAVSAPRQTEPLAQKAQAASKEGDFTFEETFFVFDYDDTILPSTWIQRQGLRLDSGSKPTPEQMAYLGEVAAVAAKTLRLARQHGTVIFVTNAERGWIELSCQKFMPTLAPMLENIRMVSARTTYEGPLAPSPLDWKLRAFEDHLARHFGEEVLSDVSVRKNVLSCGDGIHEREALLASTMTLPSCFPKSLKFVERPDISQIIKQHELISSAFDNIVHHAGNLDLRIRCP